MIKNFGLEAAGKEIRFIKQDENRFDSRVNFIQVFSQNCRVITEQECNSIIFSHSDALIREICENFVESTGLVIPDEFYNQTNVWNVPALVFSRGLHVPVRVLRQQILLGGDTYEISEQRTERLLIHGVGNALWNYIVNVKWRRDESRQNQYRRLRGLPEYASQHEYRRNRQRYQANLFFVAAEDFRYLFGTAGGGRSEWFLPSQGNDAVPAPGPDIASFWEEQLGD